jgi:hypothetical protein
MQAWELLRRVEPKGRILPLMSPFDPDRTSAVLSDLDDFLPPRH